MIDSRIEILRKKMKLNNIDIYLIPTSDYHESEYVSEYFKCREFITGFTGSAGTAVITMNEACLWVDGRYFVQAGEQIKNSSIILMRSGVEGVPTIEEYISKNLKSNMTLGFDGKVVNTKFGESLKELVENVNINYENDLISEIWENRPEMKISKAWILDEKYSGESAKSKINKIRKEMKNLNSTSHIITTLDDIAWILNLRGNDILCNPVIFSYLILKENSGILFINNEALDDEVKNYIQNIGIEIRNYNSIYDYIKTIENENILLEKSVVNYTIYETLKNRNTIVDNINPSVSMKLLKNDIEIDNIRKAHIKDAIAVTKYMYWIKNNIDKKDIDEVSGAEYLEQLRKQQQHYIEPSFETISAYGSNAAMCHYLPKKGNCAKLQQKGFYLVDSGGQYLEGTTDITRTFVVGELTEEQKEHFTITAISNLRLANTKFLYGCTGSSLDCITRSAFWQKGLDYNHGTGHGVGYLLNVHERPTRINWKTISNDKLEEGLLISNEPGIYIEGSHGIRIENLMLCKKLEKNQYGQFMGFEVVTFVPIDLDAIDTKYMTEEDVNLLNDYHKQVYDNISEYMTEQEKEWLKEYTKPIKK